MKAQHLGSHFFNLHPQHTVQTLEESVLEGHIQHAFDEKILHHECCINYGIHQGAWHVRHAQFLHPGLLERSVESIRCTNVRCHPESLEPWNLP